MNYKTTIFRSMLVMSAFWMSTSSAAVLDFESFVHGQVIDTEYQPIVTISAQNRSSGPDLAVVFDSTLTGTRDPDLEGTFNSNNPNLADNFDPGNILIVQENDSGCGDGICNYPDDEGSRPAGIITFDFAQAITLESIDFFDVEGAETANNAIRLFDSVGDELLAGAFFTPNTGGDNLWDQVVFNVAGISKIEVNFGGSGALDNLVYSVSEVPVPAAVFLFAPALLGFVGLRRRVKLNNV